MPPPKPKQKPRAIEAPVVLVTADQNAERSICKSLADAQLDTTVCREGGRALRVHDLKPKRWSPRTFIIDVSLPGMSGFELVRRLHERYGTRPIAIFLITTYEYPEDKLEAINAGAVALLKKPVKVEDLNAALDGERNKRARVKTARLVFGPV